MQIGNNSSYLCLGPNIIMADSWDPDPVIFETLKSIDIQFWFPKTTKSLFTSLNKFWAVCTTFILLMACVLFIIREIMIVKRHVLERRSNSLHWPWKTTYHTCGIINASLGRTRALACSINLTSRHVPPSSVGESVKGISFNEKRFSISNYSFSKIFLTNVGCVYCVYTQYYKIF